MPFVSPENEFVSVPFLQNPRGSFDVNGFQAPESGVTYRKMETTARVPPVAARNVMAFGARVKERCATEFLISIIINRKVFV